MDAENKLALGANAMALITEGAEAFAMPAAAPIAALQALTLIPDVNGQIVLPAGVELDDIRVSGRDLIITMPDGTQMVITDGAIFVPQFVLDGIAVPPLNIAALLIGQETAPAAGRPTSSGGNFEDPVGDIGDPFARGDLLPPTQLAFPQPEEREIIPNEPDEEPTTIIITPDQPAGSVSATASVNEAGLPARGGEPAGSNEAANGETTTGSIIFNVPDGLGSISLNGVAITAVGQVFTAPLGQLTITSIATGNIGYTYTLLDNSTNPTATDIFAVAVVDSDDDTATANLTITINDDTPTARDDNDSVPAANFTAQTGNVITGLGTTSGAAGVDTPGADGAAVTGARAGISGAFAAVGSAINGAFGVLTLNTNGSYSYTRNPNTPGGVTDTFSYQITDGDGDTSTATLAISIGDSPATVLSVPSTGGGTVVDEEGLPPRGSEPPGSNEAAPIETTTGTITFSAPDGVASVQVNGVTISGPGQVISTPTGTFTVTGFSPTSGTLNYTFTLTDNTSGDSTTQVLTVTVTDTDGDSDSESFTITIVDDAPTARNDSGAQTAENSPVTVNVIGNDTPGADGVNLATGVAAVPGSLTGSGTLAYNNDGSFTYTPTPNEQGSVTFQYRITDGDGDVAAATVTINLLEDSTLFVNVNGDNDVAEAGLPARGSEPSGSDAAANSEIAVGTIAAATGGDSIASLVINGVNVTAGGTVTTISGTLAVTLSAGVYSYIYTLNDNTSGDATTDNFNVVLTDSDGDVATDMLSVRIIDDVPSAVADTNGVTEGAVVTGNVLTDGVDDIFGADGASATMPAGGVVGVAAGSNIAAAVSGGLGAPIVTSLGSLTLNADGSYSYDALPNTTADVATDSFVYTIMDSDGDTSTVTLTIAIDPVTLVADNDRITVDEAALNVVGSNPGSAAETGGGTLAVAGAVGYTLLGGGAGTYGALTLNANGSYSYTLTTPVDGTAANNGANTELGRDMFTYTATDANGNMIGGTITIDIIDDVPTARDDSAGLTEGGAVSTSFDVDTNDTPGADGTDSRVFSALAGTYGNLTLNVDGTQTYTLNAVGQAAIDALVPGAILQDAFNYTLTDGDGDTDLATLTVTLTGADDPVLISDLTPAAGGGDAVVDEDDLLAGSDASPGPLTATGNFTITAADGVDDLTVGGVLVIQSGLFVAPAPTTTPLGNMLTFVSYVPATGVITYSYTLAAAQTHATANGQNDLFENFAVSLTDSDGDVATDMLSVRIIDDVPSANDDAVTQMSENTAVTFTVFGNDVFGADGVDTDNNPSPRITFTQPPVGQGSVSYNAATGQFTFTPAPGQIGSTSFTYTITDADDDSDPATVTIALAADSMPAVVNVVAAVDDEGLPGGIAGLLANGDIDANLGDSGAGLGNEAVFVGQINVNFGGDTGAVSFSNLHGTTAMVGAETVTFGWNAGANTLTATGPRGVLFTVNLTPSGAYTVTLVDNVLHAPGGNEASAPVVNLNYLATDSDGDMNSAGVLAITFNDDTPVAIAPMAITVTNAAGSTGLSSLDADGNIDNNVGADQLGLVRLPSTLEGATTLTSNGQVIYYFVAADGQTLTATTDSSGIANTSRWVFTVEINQDFNAALANDRYEVTLFNSVDSTESIIFNPATFDFLGGNTHWVGFVPLGQENIPVNDGSEDLLITPIANGDTANGNANEVGSGGAGGGSLAVGPNQGLRLDFVNDLLGNPASGGGGYVGPSNHSFDGHYQVTGATIRFGVGGSANNTTTVRLIAFDDNDSGNRNEVGNGTQDPITRIVITYNTDTISTADDVTFTVDTSTPGTDTIAFGGNIFTVTTDMSGAVNFNGVQNGVSIGVFTANAFTTVEARYVAGREFTLTGFGTTAITNDPVNLSIPVQLQDADGDIVASSNLAITLNPATPPIVLDLDGDGAEFLSRSAGVTFDYQGDGSPESTAWVGADDGLLAIDLNSDGTVNNGSEIVFGRDGQTDLEGLATVYDSDGNGVLDASDAAFAQFGIWQDTNSNGVTDVGEFRSLSDAGIASISLQSNGQRYSAANGDVVVHGETTFARADGSVGIVADTSFAVGAAQAQQREQINSNALVAASLIALAGADVAVQDAAFAMIRDQLETREVDLDSAPRPPSSTEPTSDAAPTMPHSDYLSEVETVDTLQLDTMPITQLWGTTGLAPKDMPVVRHAPAETDNDNMVQQPVNGASILSQSIPTGFIDALLLVRDSQTEQVEQDNPALPGVIADTLNDNNIDDLLDQLAGPASESFVNEPGPLMGDNTDLANSLINMPVSSNVMTHITGVSISDQLQDMAVNQG